MKKINLLVLLVLPLAFGMTFSSCKKYDDGPALSLRSKKERAANKWRIEQIFETPNGGSKTDKTTEYKNAYVNYVMTLDKGGSYTIYYRPYNIGDYNENGAWFLGAGKTNLVLTNSTGNGSSIGSVWNILRLKEKELWISTVNSNNVTIEAHLLPN